MADKLKDRVAIVTGGASGIGRAAAVRFAQEGADVVVADLNGEKGAETVDMVEDAGRKAIFVRCDTTSEADCDALVEQAVADFGKVDAAVLSAGIATAAGPSDQNRLETGAGHVLNLSSEVFKRVIEVNLVGVMQSARAIGRQMHSQGTGGSIVTIASSAAKIPLAGASPYCCSKAGVWMFTKVMALELAKTGIRVNAVGPGYTRTPMIDGIEQNESAFASAMSITHMNRLGTPEEQANACLFLASDESSFFTGQILHPAGGQMTE
jgi:NAD(P)-dependent dehydrogenase (short-subunit alcohol dehydrogenase family)